MNNKIFTNLSILSKVSSWRESYVRAITRGPTGTHCVLCIVSASRLAWHHWNFRFQPTMPPTLTETKGIPILAMGDWLLKFVSLSIWRCPPPLWMFVSIIKLHWFIVTATCCAGALTGLANATRAVSRFTSEYYPVSVVRSHRMTLRTCMILGFHGMHNLDRHESRLSGGTTGCLRSIQKFARITLEMKTSRRILPLQLSKMTLYSRSSQRFLRICRLYVFIFVIMTLFICLLFASSV